MRKQKPFDFQKMLNLNNLIRFSPIIFCFLIIENVNSQNSEINVRGKVKQAVSGKGVKSKIVYKSYPTGSISGTFYDSTFAFTIFGSSKYVITAEAPGHITNAILIDPKEAKNKEINRSFEIT